MKNIHEKGEGDVSSILGERLARQLERMWPYYGDPRARFVVDETPVTPQSNMHEILTVYHFGKDSSREVVDAKVALTFLGHPGYPGSDTDTEAFRRHLIDMVLADPSIPMTNPKILDALAYSMSFLPPETLTEYAKGVTDQILKPLDNKWWDYVHEQRDMIFLEGVILLTVIHESLISKGSFNVDTSQDLASYSVKILPEFINLLRSLSVHQWNKEWVIGCKRCLVRVTDQLNYLLGIFPYLIRDEDLVQIPKFEEFLNKMRG